MKHRLDEIRNSLRQSAAIQRIDRYVENQIYNHHKNLERQAVLFLLMGYDIRELAVIQPSMFAKSYVGIRRQYNSNHIAHSITILDF